MYRRRTPPPRFRVQGFHTEEINNMLRREHARQVPDQWLFNWAHAVLDEKGVPRSDRRFPLLVAALSVYASLRWNRRITPRVAATSRQWTAMTFRNYYQRTPSR